MPYLLEYFGRDRYQWPTSFYNLRLYDYREIVVHLQPGLSIAARTANVLISILAVVSGDVGLQEGEVEKCGIVEKSRSNAWATTQCSSVGRGKVLAACILAE